MKRLGKPYHLEYQKNNKVYAIQKKKGKTQLLVSKMNDFVEAITDIDGFIRNNEGNII